MARRSVAFSAEVAAWCKKAEGRLEAVMKTAAQDLAESANTPTEKGGRMRVDTGFLRGSIAANIGTMPSGPSLRPKDARPGQFSPQEITITIARWNPATQTLCVGWTANYAKWRELHDGFLEAAVQKWPQFVNAAVAEAKRRIP